MPPLAARLREEAQRAGERRLLVLAGEPAATRSRATDALHAAEIPAEEVDYLGPGDAFTSHDLPVTHRERSDHLLGTTRTAIVVDCHAATRPNDLGRAAGAVDGGGLLVLLAPPLSVWPTRRDHFDETLAVPPFAIEDVAGNFRTRLVETLRTHPGVAIVDVDADEVSRDGLTDPPPREQPAAPSPPADPDFPATAYEACLTSDQAGAVAAFEGLASKTDALVVEADRGRGKSSAAGLAAASLALEGKDVLVTASAYDGAATLFERARELLVELGELASREPDERPRLLETETGRVRFAEPTTAALLPNDPDVVVVDEAAALPVRLLEQFLAADAAAFVTTIHGYEGAGRGFSVRFRDRLAASDRAVTDVRLETPIRYAPGDPVEVWAFRALALDARPATDQVVADADPATVEYRSLEPTDLLEDEVLLREAFGLLVLAHYRTEPDDLARLLDAPNLGARTLVHDDHVVAVALLAREGDLPAERRAAMYEGGRIRGNMLPDVLTSQLRDEEAGELVGQRVVRIATHPAVRSRGLGSALLESIREEFATDADWLGTGYGATPALLSFWRANGYRTVHLSTTRNDASGEHSAIMLDPCSPAGEDLLERHTEWFHRRLPSMLADSLADVEPDVVRGAIRSVAGTPDLDLSPTEWRHVAGIPHGAAIFDTAPRPCRRLALRHLVAPVDPDLLSARKERLLVAKALQARPWPMVAEALDFPGTSASMRAFGDAVGALVTAYGGEVADAERRRFE